MNIKTVIAYTDGSSIKAKGGGCHGGVGVVLLFNGRMKEISHPIPDGTNNISELTACILALEALKEPCKVTLHTDSQYCIKSMTQWLSGWKSRGWMTANKGAVKNVDLIKRLDQLCQTHCVEWVWVKGHSGVFYNEKADELACKASASLKENEIG
ncbi:Rnase H [Vibrio phage 11895-B1]|uniref:Rnase H n=1 Tax=Vibrio phage 11895-B1 TaxID=754075 RepID=UPI0002C0DB3B|nr:Rnase H [Vibrio phage 11895-B1]AGH32146.1 hypothetical protein VPHG_00079 [Vibrio phage 11895-B1]